MNQTLNRRVKSLNIRHMFEVGDVVRFFSPTASKEKFHLCLGQSEQGPVFVFLHLNSRSGFKGDCILDDGAIPGLPKSPTGETVVSFSNLVRMNEERLLKFGATKTGRIESEVAGELVPFAKTVASLNRNEQSLVIAALERLIS